MNVLMSPDKWNQLYGMLVVVLKAIINNALTTVKPVY